MPYHSAVALNTKTHFLPIKSPFISLKIILFLILKCLIIEIMKINGLKMRNYWISYFIFNCVVYAVTIIFFVIFGTYVFGLNLFKETSFLLIFLTLVIWGMAQIGLSFFFQAFLSNGRTTSIIGYMIALWLIIICTCLNLAMFHNHNKSPYNKKFLKQQNLEIYLIYKELPLGLQTWLNSDKRK